MNSLGTALSHMLDWSRQAACREHDSELFFPVGAEGSSEQVAAAKQVCDACPVQRECLEYAVETGQRHGIWGGMTADERRSRRARLRSVR